MDDAGAGQENLSIGLNRYSAFRNDVPALVVNRDARVCLHAGKCLAHRGEARGVALAHDDRAAIRLNGSAQERVAGRERAQGDASKAARSESRDPAAVRGHLADPGVLSARTY